MSRSPDLRIISLRTAFSGIFPMTDFRLVRGLHAYSGGTVPDLHRIHYSPLSLRRYQRHSNLYSIQSLCRRTKKYPGGLETRAPLRPQMRKRREFIVSDPLHTASQRNTNKKCASCRHETQRKRPHRKRSKAKTQTPPPHNAVRPNRKRSSGFGRMLSTVMYLA